MSDSYDPTDCTPPGSSVHGIFQAGILEWVAISFSRGSSVPRSPICISWVSCISRQILYHLYHLGRHFHYLHSLKKNLPPLSLFHVLYYLSFWIAKRWAECNLVQVFRILHPPPKKNHGSTIYVHSQSSNSKYRDICTVELNIFRMWHISQEGIAKHLKYRCWYGNSIEEGRVGVTTHSLWDNAWRTNLSEHI